MKLPKVLHELPGTEGKKTKIFHPYRLAKLNDKGQNLKLEWYIEFWAWDVDRNQLRRKRLTKINSITSISERLVYAARQIDLINEGLKSGYVFNDVELQRAKLASTTGGAVTIEQAFNAIMELQRGILKQQNSISFDNYERIVKRFIRWLKRNKYHNLLLPVLNRNMVQQYASYLSGKNLSGVTVNNYLATLRALINKMIAEHWISENPFNGIKKKKTIVTERFYPFNTAQIKEIKAYTLAKDVQMWYIINFIFYAYIRPNELRQLRVKHILETKINIPGSISKNGLSAQLEITGQLHQIINEMKLNQYKQNDFVFSLNKKPGPVMLHMVTLGRRFSLIMDRMKYPKEFSLYSWKHTGVIMAYKKGVSIKALQFQLRHSNILATDKYLKALGLVENTEFLTKMDVQL